MSRRSERQAVSNAATSSTSGVATAPVDSVFSDDVPPSGDDDEFEAAIEEDPEEETSKKKTAGTKRKRAERKTAQGQPSNKKVRGKRGSLKDLLEMNVDVVYEIFGRLDPIDLLHLAWASKMTRNFLMSKSSKSLWKAARSNIPGLPDCPEDLSEPQYANLAFGKSCHFCLRNLNNVHIVWAARVRICAKCMDIRFAPMSHRSHYGPPHMSTLRTLIPKTVITRSGRRGRREEYYYYDLDKKWEREHAEAEDKQEWVQSKIAKQQAINTHSEACARWYTIYRAQLEDERASLIQSRVDVIADRLRDMGWATEIEDMRQPDSRVSLVEHPAVLKACQKDLTERVIQNLLPTLDDFMKIYREKRLIRDREKLLQKRIPLLSDAVTTYKSTIRPDGVALEIGDIFSYPEVRDLMVNTPDELEPAHLDPIRANLPDIAFHLQLDIEERLAGFVKAACGSHGLDGSSLLALATTIFCCNYCCSSSSYDPIRYPRVLVHHCATKIGWNLDVEKDPEFRLLARVTGKLPWNRLARISFNEEAHKVLVDVVTSCGFDPATTTAAQMDEADPILECVTCNDPHSGRFTMRWMAVPEHAKKEHSRANKGPMKLDLLEDEEAELVRSRMDEDVLRRRANSTCSDLICTYCPTTGNSVSVRRHIKHTHSISKPSEENGDFVVGIDTRPILSTYLLWPPRDEDEPVVTAPTQ